MDDFTAFSRLCESFKHAASATMICQFTAFGVFEIRDKFGRKEHEILTVRSRDIGASHLSICSSVRPCCSAGAITSSAPSHPS